MDETLKIIKNQGLTKGASYFEQYHVQSRKPWFMNSTKSRDYIVTMCRSRSNHNSLKGSLVKIKVIEDPTCECGHHIQHLNHVIWECPIFCSEREHMITALRKIKQLLPLDIKCLLRRPNSDIMGIVYEYIIKCKIVI